MTKTSMLVSVIMVATFGVADAGGQAGSIGVGAEAQLNGQTEGISINYDGGKYHFGGFLGLDDPPGPSNDTFDIGGRFYYHLHSTAMADFGLGGQINIASVPPAGMGGNRATEVFIEPGFQIRAFVASNVALSFTGGIVIGAADASGLAIDGQVVGFAGVHYYFF